MWHTLWYMNKKAGSIKPSRSVSLYTRPVLLAKITHGQYEYSHGHHVSYKFNICWYFSCFFFKLQVWHCIALLRSGCTLPRNCSSLKTCFSAPNHGTDMKLFVFDRNNSKNEYNLFSIFYSLLKIGRQSIKHSFYCLPKTRLV